VNILITGGSGSLGTALKKYFTNALIPTHKVLDICNKQALFDYLQNNDIDLVIHTAALTSVRFCEENKRLALDTNVNGTKNLVSAILSSEKKIFVIYVSTACVFDGHDGMYDENSIPYPENFYALTKLLAECEISKLKEYLIIRTNFVAKKQWPYPKAFTDRFGTYLFADDVAKGIIDVQKENIRGIVHVVGTKKISMYELAKMTTPNIQPMTIQDYSGPRLTMDMSLNTIRWKKYNIDSSS
jgi:dTDP-4-dehydrorhamnose reductase